MTDLKLDHLGGHLDMTHVDEGALRWLKSLGVNTMLDVGCSVGGQVELALHTGISAFGLEGDYSLLQQNKLRCPSRILFSDLTVSHVIMPTQFDAIWCVEVAEHIEEKFTSNLLDTIVINLKQNSGILVFTANEGPGIHHVNCQSQQWWIDRLTAYNLRYDPDLTAQLKKVSTMKREFIRNTGMIFKSVPIL